ncbi:MAG: hypothetical protein ABSE52_00525 [Candidatus Dormibacteria bacterium]|jgi:hypothetical protein
MRARPGPGPIPVGAAAPTSSRRPSLWLASLAGLVVGLIVAALWVVATVQTGLLLAELAVVVGLASGLILRRAARRGGVGPAICAFVIAVVAIGLGMAAAALDLYSGGTWASFQAALEHLHTALLPHLWKEIGETGALLGGAGVVVATLIGLLRLRTPPA